MSEPVMVLVWHCFETVEIECDVYSPTEKFLEAFDRNYEEDSQVYNVTNLERDTDEGVYRYEASGRTGSFEVFGQETWLD